MSIINLRESPIPPHPEGWGLFEQRVEGMQIDIRSLTVSVDNLTDLTEESFENLNTTAKNGFGNLGGKMDQTPNRQEETNRERTNLMNMMTPHIQRRSRQLGTELTET